MIQNIFCTLCKQFYLQPPCSKISSYATVTVQTFRGRFLYFWLGFLMIKFCDLLIHTDRTPLPWQGSRGTIQALYIKSQRTNYKNTCCMYAISDTLFSTYKWYKQQISQTDRWTDTQIELLSHQCLLTPRIVANTISTESEWCTYVAAVVSYTIH